VLLTGHIGELNLDSQVAAREQTVYAIPAESALLEPKLAREQQQPASAHAVLWVDDHPESNALLDEQLQQNAVRVDLAKSTTGALAYLRQRRYGKVLSDMGRTENGANVPDAGMNLLRAIVDSSMNIPVLFYTSSFAASAYADEATAAARP
jgi:CheY-like chemotaxis protein